MIHGDQIFENLDSPNAFDEVFLKLYNNKNELIYEFPKHISLILKKIKKKDIFQKITTYIKN